VRASANRLPETEGYVLTTTDSRRASEPMCALDPLLLIPRIEHVEDVYDWVLAAAEDYCLVILDIKNFHVINDIYNYDTGDAVIVQFVRGLRRRLPQGSITLRFRHGDEFLFFVPGEAAQTESVFRTFRDFCEATPALTVAQQDIFVSFRFAAMNLGRSNESVRMVLANAEKALREVKGQGSPRA
jgi:diguanylate cyclase (GGDEF)-like protein